MIVLNTKSFNELYNESNLDLEAAGFSSTPGSIARLFMNIVNKNIGDLYDTLTVNHLRAFVTTSDGNALDEIGVLLRCTRMTNETDDNYRYRITRQCLSLATSNETAVRLAVLTTPNVDDCIMKEYAMGAGSFGIIIIPNPNANASTVLENTRKRVEKSHGYGIRYVVDFADNTFVKIKQHIVISDKLSDIEKQDLRYQTVSAITDYFNSLSVGDMIITDKITQAIMNVSPDIIQEMKEEFYINDERALYVNQSCRWRERFVLSTDIDSVVVT